MVGEEKYCGTGEALNLGFVYAVSGVVRSRGACALLTIEHRPEQGLAVLTSPTPIDIRANTPLNSIRIHTEC